MPKENFGQRMLSLLADRGPGGGIVRTAVPVAIVVNILLGLAAWAGNRFGLFGGVGASGLIAAGNLAIVTIVAVWAADRVRAEYDERRRIETEIPHQVMHDALTGLANRPLFMDQLARRIALADRKTASSFAVFCLDLDGFKRINDQLGQAAGDRILVGVGETIRDCVRSSDLVSRLGGDDFAILLEGLTDRKDVDILARRIMAAIPETLDAMGCHVPVGISIGVALNASGGDQPGNLLRHAEAALRRAKMAGPGRYELATLPMRPPDGLMPDGLTSTA